MSALAGISSSESPPSLTLMAPLENLSSVSFDFFSQHLPSSMLEPLMRQRAHNLQIAKDMETGYPLFFQYENIKPLVFPEHVDMAMAEKFFRLPIHHRPHKLILLMHAAIHRMIQEQPCILENLELAIENARKAQKVENNQSLTSLSKAICQLSSLFTATIATYYVNYHFLSEVDLNFFIQTNPQIFRVRQPVLVPERTEALLCADLLERIRSRFFTEENFIHLLFPPLLKWKLQDCYFNHRLPYGLI